MRKSVKYTSREYVRIFLLKNFLSQKKHLGVSDGGIPAPLTQSERAKPSLHADTGPLSPDFLGAAAAVTF